MTSSPLPETAAVLGTFITTVREDAGWDSEIDIICHSVGTCIARHLLEVIDGTERQERVRQLIGLGPSNKDSALAELICNPQFGPGIIDRLTGVFVPKGFNPDKDPLVQDVHPSRSVMKALRASGIRKDIYYRVIVTANPTGIPAFFPNFSGETYDSSEDGTVRMTRNGDGIVTPRESELPEVTLDVLPAGNESDKPLPAPDQYSHIRLSRNPVVIDQMMKYCYDFVKKRLCRIPQ
ncbi:MAG: hypothetical protein A4E35_02260 [Methanoregula sp. PtaU1.Bin051]|nr:MAG: hypothetical protein A4E35_02260 [Methanoregula sp. PtaU1.Bin051]